MRSLKHPLAALALVATAACAHAPRPAAPAAAFATGVAPPIAPPMTIEPIGPAAAPIALVHARIWTGVGAPARVIEDGTIVLSAGRIAAIGGPEVAPPEGARIVDAGGRWVTPGIIDSHSHLGVYPSPEVAAHEDGNEMTGAVTAEVSAEHGLWPLDPGFSRAAAGGVTSMLILPGSANLIGGRGVVVKNRPARSARAMRFPGARDMLKIACGENPKRIYGQDRKAPPMTRMGNVAGYRTAFAQARDYLTKWEAWEKSKKAQGEPAPARDLKLETLGAVLRGEIWVQNHCYRADEMLQILAVADEFGFRVRSFHHALEAYKIRDVLAARQVAVSTWADWWGFKMEAFDGIPENLALVHEAGGRAIVHSDSPMGIQRLNQEAGKALASGRAAGIAVTEDDALRWITANPAWALGVDGEVGTLAAGKMADVVLWSSHPLSVYALADLVMVDGEVVHERAKGMRKADFELGLSTGEGEVRP